jgi:hypothetical protein
MAGGGIAVAMTELPYGRMADIGQVRNTPITWPTTHSVKPAGQQPRQSDKQYKQQDEPDKRDDDNDPNHIDEYA